MSDNILIVSSSDVIIEEITKFLNEYGITDIIICQSKSEAFAKINVNTNVKLLILEQDLKDDMKSNRVVEFNGENIAIKMMRDDLEIPTVLIGTKPIQYEDDNTIAKINVAVVNLIDAIKEVLISLKFIEDKEVISNEQTVIS